LTSWFLTLTLVVSEILPSASHRTFVHEAGTHPCVMWAAYVMVTDLTFMPRVLWSYRTGRNSRAGSTQTVLSPSPRTKQERFPCRDLGLVSNNFRASKVLISMSSGRYIRMSGNVRAFRRVLPLGSEVRWAFGNGTGPAGKNSARVPACHTSMVFLGTYAF